jgi:hypothetical protein
MLNCTALVRFSCALFFLTTALGVCLAEEQSAAPILLAPVFSAKAKSLEQSSPVLVSIDFDVLQGLQAPGTRASIIVDTQAEVETLAYRTHREGYTWIGQVAEAQPYNRLVMTVVAGVLHGRLTIGEQVYWLRPAGGDNLYELTLRDETGNFPIGDDMVLPEVPASRSGAAPKYAQPKADSATTIDVLLLYTPGLAASHPGGALPSFLQYLVDLANQSYADSEISLELRVVHSAEIDYTDDGSVSTPLYELTSDSGTFSGIAAMRDAYGADLVCLIRQFRPSNTSCGIAWVLPSLVPEISEEYGFSVVETGLDGEGYYCDDYTFAHELGHNMGCAHDRDHASVPGIFDYSYGYDVPEVFATIMSYDLPAIGFFSNPDLEYSGHPLGIPAGEPDAADNTLTITQTKGVIEQYRDPQYTSLIATGAISVNQAWQSVPVATAFSDPIVILGPPTYHDSQPGVVRLRNVDPDSFEVRFQEWDYLDGKHPAEMIPYVVAQQGRHTTVDGVIWEAGTFQLSGTGSWGSQAFTQSFPSTPALFLTAQTFNGGQAVTVRASEVDAAGFKAALFEEEALMDGHVTEEIGYLAFYSPRLSGSIEIGETQVPYLMQVKGVDHRFVPVLSSAIKLEEEQSKDTETAHIDETVCVLALGEQFFAQDISGNGGDSVALRRIAPESGAVMEWGTVYGVNHKWLTVPLAKEYLNPVVVVKPVSALGGDPGVIRMRDVAHDSFEVIFDEWKYKDGYHALERVFYLVSEAGTQTVAGLSMEAGTLNSSKLLLNGWNPATFSTSFSDTPAVFTMVQTFNGADPVTTRVHDCTALGFDVTMDEEEAIREGGHTSETLGWIAVEKGSGTTDDNRTLAVLSGYISHVPAVIEFGRTMSCRFPTVLADIVTTYGTDPCSLRYKALGPSSIELYLQEEASLDAEMNHVAEGISIFAAE